MSEADTSSFTLNEFTDVSAIKGQELISHEPFTAGPVEKIYQSQPEQQQQQPPPPPPPPPTPPLRSSLVVRTSEFTSSSSAAAALSGSAASPSLSSSINTTPRLGSSKRYPTHLTPTTYGDRKVQSQQYVSKAPMHITAPTLPMARENTYLFYGSTDNPLNNNIGSGIQYPHLLVPTTKLKPISQCAVLCCFYAEFDNTVGPKICYQYPPNFVSELDIQSTTKQLEDALHKALLPKATNENMTADLNTQSTTTNTDLQQEQEYADGIHIISSTGETPKASGGRSVAGFATESSTTIASTSPTEEMPSLPVSKNNRVSNTNSNSTTANNCNTSSESSSSTIFDSCSEYIITGSELAGNIINVSTHNIHLLSRPTILIDEETYERNTLLFSVGFVLRRKMDPQPYKPILSKLVMTIRDMEIESQFISQRKEQIQSILEGIVRSMNSYNTNGECNMLLGPADVLHFKLFRPPHPHVKPVNDYSVPILVRRDWLHQGVCSCFSSSRISKTKRELPQVLTAFVFLSFLY